MNVPYQLKQIGVAIAQDRLVAPLKQVPHGAVAAVVALGITELYPLHDLGKRHPFCFHQHMNVVGHQNIGVEHKPKALPILLHPLQISLAVLVVTKDAAPLVAPHDYMIKSTIKLNSRLACHAPPLLRSPPRIQTQA